MRKIVQRSLVQNLVETCPTDEVQYLFRLYGTVARGNETAQKSQLAGLIMRSEDNLKIILNDRMDKLREKEQRFDRLKCHAEDKVQQANDAIQQIQTNGEVEMARLATMLRKSELKVETLDQTMRQKSEESRELAQMCDELICCAQSKPRYTL